MKQFTIYYTAQIQRSVTATDLDEAISMCPKYPTTEEMNDADWEFDEIMTLDSNDEG